MLRGIGPTEILIVLGIIVLLFGGRKLPELARGGGRALRIFRSEVKAIEKDDTTALDTDLDAEVEQKASEADTETD